MGTVVHGAHLIDKHSALRTGRVSDALLHNVAVMRQSRDDAEKRDTVRLCWCGLSQPRGQQQETLSLLDDLTHPLLGSMRLHFCCVSPDESHGRAQVLEDTSPSPLTDEGNMPR